VVPPSQSRIYDSSSIAEHSHGGDHGSNDHHTDDHTDDHHTANPGVDDALTRGRYE